MALAFSSGVSGCGLTPLSLWLADLGWVIEPLRAAVCSFSNGGKRQINVI